MTKVLHIITRMDMGGSAQNTLITCRELAKKYRVVLAYGLSLESHMTNLEKQSVESQLEMARIKGVKIVPVSAMVRRIYPIQDIKTFIFLWKLMQREKPDIIHTHSSKAGLLGRVAAKIARIPIIVHTPHGHVFYGHFGPIVSNIFMLIERCASLITDCTISLTEGEKKDYIIRSVGNEGNIKVIHSGVDIKKYMNTSVNIDEKKRSLGLNPGIKIVGTVGWLLPVKGPMILLEAMTLLWNNHSAAQLVYVGKGNLEKALKRQASKKGVSDKVVFLGWRDDVHEIIPVFDVFVLPSLNEGMGRVLVEAMAAGKPVVASNAGGIPGLVRDGKNGLLVEPGDVCGLAVAIKKLLGDEKTRLEMGTNGRAKAENFSIKIMVEKIDDLYGSLLNEKKELHLDL